MQHEALVVTGVLLIGFPVLALVVLLMAGFAKLMGEIHSIISVPLFIIFPPVFFAFLAGLPCILLLNAMSDSIAEARANKRYSELRRFSRSEPRAEREAKDAPAWEHQNPNWRGYIRRERRIEARAR